MKPGSESKSVVLVSEAWGSQGPGVVSTLAPMGTATPHLVACPTGFDEVMEHVGEDRFVLRLRSQDHYFRATPNVKIDTRESPEGVGLGLSVPRASEADIVRGLHAAERHFVERAVKLYTAAYALFYLEGEYDVPKEAREWAKAWSDAPGVAVAACCAGWEKAPAAADCDLWPYDLTKSDLIGGS